MSNWQVVDSIFLIKDPSKVVISFRFVWIDSLGRKVSVQVSLDSECSGLLGSTTVEFSGQARALRGGRLIEEEFSGIWIRVPDLFVHKPLTNLLI